MPDRQRAMFPLTPAVLAAGDYVSVGPAAAVYLVTEVKHGRDARDSNPHLDLLLRMFGSDVGFTRDTEVMLEPVDPHDVPWDVEVRVLQHRTAEDATASAIKAASGV